LLSLAALSGLLEPEGLSGLVSLLKLPVVKDGDNRDTRGHNCEDQQHAQGRLQRMPV